ncbi:SRPBCC domain-containing protein [Oligoflexus tunisiensis]|uniref:SRPBCC domain-containing protein n=1 Tax=Oligoflexus tunisiensis TaxID=708132 RepID=UPI00114CFC5B|nr:SRPBCC domain-containing protein [Oligoflexus tunisiensis]
MAQTSMFQTEVQESFIIPAAGREVFATLMQWARYPEWNPYITRIEGQAQVGAPIQVYFFMGLGPRLPLSCRVAQTDHENQVLAWDYKATLSWLYSARHSFVIEDLKPGQCRIVQTEKIHGLAACRLLGWFHRLLGQRFQAMHEALRDQVQRSAA